MSFIIGKLFDWKKAFKLWIISSPESTKKLINEIEEICDEDESHYAKIDFDELSVFLDEDIQGECSNRRYYNKAFDMYIFYRAKIERNLRERFNLDVVQCSLDADPDIPFVVGKTITINNSMNVSDLVRDITLATEFLLHKGFQQAEINVYEYC